MTEELKIQRQQKRKTKKGVRLIRSENCNTIAVFGQKWPHGCKDERKTASDLAPYFHLLTFNGKRDEGAVNFGIFIRGPPFLGVIRGFRPFGWSEVGRSFSFILSALSFGSRAHRSKNYSLDTHRKKRSKEK